MANIQDPVLQKILYDTPKGSANSFYNHLVQVLSFIDNKSLDSTTFEELEKLSHFIKSNAFQYSQPQSSDSLLKKQFIDEFGVKKFSSTALNFISKSYSFSQIQLIQNTVQDNFDWNLAGYGFGEKEIYYLQKSLENLAKKSNLKDMQFWGKITCTGRDYFVAYGELSDFIRDSCPSNWEPEGEGLNRIAFYVTNDILEEWIQLPLIGPEHITVARQIIYQFSGDLNAPVNTFLPFDGKEKHMLKAQIVRIHFSAQIVPAGAYQTNEDNERIVERMNDPDAPPELADKETLASIDGWVHYNPEILKMGRINYYIPEGTSEDDKDELVGKFEDKDPLGDRLKPIADDIPDDESPFKYRFRIYGDSQQFNLADSDDGPISYDVVIIRNPFWPGWTTFYNSNKKTWSSLYFGNGVKDRQQFIPNRIPDFEKETRDLNEHDEPNHFEPPKPEIDGEEEGEEEQDEED